jgi:hypothetical protein
MAAIDAGDRDEEPTSQRIDSPRSPTTACAGARDQPSVRLLLDSSCAVQDVSGRRDPLRRAATDRPRTMACESSNPV